MKLYTGGSARALIITYTDCRCPPYTACYELASAVYFKNRHLIARHPDAGPSSRTSRVREGTKLDLKGPARRERSFPFTGQIRVYYVGITIGPLESMLPETTSRGNYAVVRTRLRRTNSLNT